MKVFCIEWVKHNYFPIQITMNLYHLSTSMKSEKSAQKVQRFQKAVEMRRGNL